MSKTKELLSGLCLAHSSRTRWICDVRKCLPASPSLASIENPMVSLGAAWRLERLWMLGEALDAEKPPSETAMGNHYSSYVGFEHQVLLEVTE